MWKNLQRRLNYWFHRDSRHDNLREEMEFHIAELAAEYEAQGDSPALAQSKARKQFGNSSAQADEARDAWVNAWLADAAQDLRYGVRSLIHQPGFAAFATAILAIGIGACATVFGVLNTLVLRPLPVKDPASLVWVQNRGEGGLSGQTIQVGHLLDLETRNTHFEMLSGYMAFFGQGETTLGDTDRQERLTSVGISQKFLPVLGVQPIIGRNFTPEECKWGAPPAIILSHRFWTRRFNANPAVIGTSIRLNNRPSTIVGIAPEAFDFGAMFAPGVRVDLFQAFPLSPETDRWGNTMSIVGRLKPGATIPAAQAEFKALSVELNKHPRRNELDAVLLPLPVFVGGAAQSYVWIVFASVLALMLIVCANLASLQLARSATRRKEFSIRSALGAGRLRLVRQIAMESLLLCATGCVIGLSLAYGALTLISRLETVRIRMLSQVRLDWETIAFTIALTTLAALLLAILPSLQLMHGPMRDSSRGSSASAWQVWTRNALVVSEVACACILLIAASLLARSMYTLLQEHLGFQPKQAMVFRMSFERNTLASFDEALRLVRAVPGVGQAGLTDAMPFGRNRTWGIAPYEDFRRREAYETGFVRIVSDGFFESMGISLRAGRTFTLQDRPETDRVVIINQAMANRFYPGKDPIGRLLRVTDEKPWQIVGVVDNLRHLSLDRDSGCEFYLPISQTRDRNGLEMVVRASRPLNTLTTPIQLALRPVDAAMSGAEFIEIDTLVSRAVSSRRVVLICLGGFAFFAMILASLGIYALIAYTVEQRRKEMGIRLALGASTGKLQGRVLFETLSLVTAGIAAGIVLAMPVARMMKGLLYGIEPTGPLSFAAMASVFLTVAFFAAYQPVRRVARIDPGEALRAEA